MARMYYETIRQMKKMLGQLDKWLEAADGARARRSRSTRTCSSGSGSRPISSRSRARCRPRATPPSSRPRGSPAKKRPSHPDTEQTLDELRARVRSVIAYLDGFSAKDFEGAATRVDHAAALGGQGDVRARTTSSSTPCRTSFSTSRTRTRSSGTTASAWASATTSDL